MLFNSYEFFVFLGAILLLYFGCPYRRRWMVLLAGSYLFYMWWRWEYGFLMLGCSWVNWYCAGRICRTTDRRRARSWLILAMTSSLAVVFIFKYYHFADATLRGLSGFFGVLELGLPSLEVLLPVGISFFTFQAMSYTVDVYRKDVEHEAHFGRFALFISFFPQLVAGPIERAGNLLRQLRRRQRFELDRVPGSLRLILWGLFKKVVIADRLAMYVERVYSEPSLYSGSTLLLATYFFAFQIYCDFSGYSDIAIGTANLFGIRLMQNFKLPYLASSIGDFWQRWHISLSTWFRDYVYFPMGGNRVGAVRFALNILAVFGISGLWHGASWTFVIWGFLHGLFYLIESALARLSGSGKKDAPRQDAGPVAAGASSSIHFLIPRALTCLRVLLTFHLVLVSWIFFRAQNLTEAWMIVRRILSEPFSGLYWGASQLSTMLGMGLIAILVLVQILQSRGWVELYFSSSRIPRPLRWCGYALMILGIAMLGVSSNQFIYFQF